MESQIKHDCANCTFYALILNMPHCLAMPCKSRSDSMQMHGCADYRKKKVLEDEKDD